MRRMFRSVLPVAVFLAAAVSSSTAFAQGADGADGSRGLIALSTALAIAVAAFGGALGQGKAAAAALDGIARNPQASGKIFTPLILSLALIESLVIYGWVIAFVLSGRL